MKITILGSGTSQGVPVVGCTCSVCTSSDVKDKRQRSSILVQNEDTNIVVDIGPDFRAQMLTHFPGELHGVLLTHEHNDHTAGIDDVRPFNFIYKKEVCLYGLPRVIRDVQQRFSYVFSAHKYPGIPQISLKQIQPWDEFTIGSMAVQALPVQHGSLDILGYKMGDFCYLTDVKFLSEEVIQQIKGVKVLILNALHHKPHHSHLNLNEALALIQRIKPQSAYLIHLSHQMGLHREIQSKLLENVKLTYDGLIISI